MFDAVILTGIVCTRYWYRERKHRSEPVVMNRIFVPCSVSEVLPVDLWVYSSNQALFQVWICRCTPPPQFCSHFHERCAQCWIEWKYNYIIFAIFIYELWLIVFTIYQKFTDKKKKITGKMRISIERILYLCGGSFVGSFRISVEYF